MPWRNDPRWSEMRIMAFVIEERAFHSGRTYLAEPTAAPELARAPGLSLAEHVPQPLRDDTPASAHRYVFDKRGSRWLC